jgi:hypothetical protein
MATPAVCTVMSQTVALGISFLLARIEKPASHSDSTNARGARAGRPAAGRRSDGRTDGRLGRAARGWWTGVLYMIPARPDSKSRTPLSECATSLSSWQLLAGGPGRLSKSQPTSDNEVGRRPPEPAYGPVVYFAPQHDPTV